MVKTITIGSCVSVQGPVIRALDDGRIVIRLGANLYTGLPVQTTPAP